MHYYDGRNKPTTLRRPSVARTVCDTVSSQGTSQWQSRAVCRAFDKRKHYFGLHIPEQVVVYEIYRARLAVNTVLIKCETDKLSDKTR